MANSGADEDIPKLDCDTVNGLNVRVEIASDKPGILRISPKVDDTINSFVGPVTIWKDTRAYKRHFVNHANRIAIRIEKEEVSKAVADDGSDLITGYGVLQGYDFTEIEVSCSYHDKISTTGSPEGKSKAKRKRRRRQ